MADHPDGYYFMCEIGWFMDLLIPTIVRVHNGRVCLVGSKTGSSCKDLKPCCVPCGGAAEVKQLAPDDPALKAFKSTDSLVPIGETSDLGGELEQLLARQDIKEKYFNTAAKQQREATEERLKSDLGVLEGGV